MSSFGPIERLGAAAVAVVLAVIAITDAHAWWEWLLGVVVVQLVLIAARRRW